MPIEEVGIRGIFESRIATNKVSFLAWMSVDRFLDSGKPGDARNQFSQIRHSKFKIRRSAFDIILIIVAFRYMIRTIITRLMLNVECRLKNEEVGIRGIFESRIATNKVSPACR